jgi:hypothetical protein
MLVKFIQKHFKTILFATFSTILLIYCAIIPFPISGDGPAYLNMAVSYSNHHSFDLRQDDLDYVFNSLQLAGDYADYYYKYTKINFIEALNHKLYNWHFGLYSFVASFFIPVFSFLKLNISSVFPFCNALFLILLLYWINFRANLNGKERFWLNLIILFGPTWYYLTWTGPEMFCFSLLFIGALEYKENKINQACLFFSVASLQNSLIILFPFFIVLEEIIKKRKIDKQVLFKILISCICFIPFIIDWLRFRVFSIIAGNFYSYHTFSLKKTLCLFFDLNFGMIVYIPMILSVFIFLCFRKDKTCIKSALVLLLMAFINSSGTNINHGVYLIERYSFWMMAIVFAATSDFFSQLDLKKFKAAVVIFILTTTIPCFLYNLFYFDYLHFGPVAKLVLNLKPSLYNPDPEIFAERAMHQDDLLKKDFGDSFIAVYKSDQFGIRKTLIIDRKKGTAVYLNNDKINFHRE